MISTKSYGKLRLSSLFKRQILFLLVIIFIIIILVKINSISLFAETLDQLKPDQPKLVQPPRDPDYLFDVRLAVIGDRELPVELIEKRLLVKKMMKECWFVYSQNAMGSNEVDPVSSSGYNSESIHRDMRGITIIDSLDTLLIMGLFEEYDTARTWVVQNLHFTKGTRVNFFESNIRVLGGLLSAYYLTLDEVFSKKAVQYAKATMSNFDNVFPSNNAVLFSTSQAITVSLAQMGTLHLEYAAISKITNDPKYVNAVKKIHKRLSELFYAKNDSLSTSFSFLTLAENSGRPSMGAEGDSFYEYLLKSHIQDSTYTLGRTFFEDAIDRIEREILVKTSDNDAYFSTSGGFIEHLSCFSGGMYALASHHSTGDRAAHYLNTARALVDTCYKSCMKTKTGLCPELFDSNSNVVDDHYYLRPELMESLFYMFRITAEEKYREMGWTLINSIHKYTRAPGGGYSSVVNLNDPKPHLLGRQESYFMAETLKYAYLLFSHPSLVSLDEYVYNTEAHPFRIFDKSL